MKLILKLLRFIGIIVCLIIIYNISHVLFWTVIGIYYFYCLARFIYYRSRIGFLRMFDGSINYLSKLAYVCVVSGNIRAGKTTFLFGASHLLTIKIQQMIYSRMAEIERILIDVNFSKIIDLYLLNSGSHQDKVNSVLNDLIVSDDVGNQRFIFDLGNLYFDHLTYQRKFKLLHEYLDLFMHSQRNDYIFSRVRAFNQLTKSYSLFLDPKWEKLKEKNDFPFDEYSVFLDDEKSLDSSNIKNAGKSEDDGADIFFRLFGQLFRETSWYLTTLQNAKRWVKSEREIAQFHIYIKQSYLVGDYPRIKKILDLIESVNQFIYRIVCKFKNVRYQDRKNLFKRISLWILQKQKYLTSRGFILFSCNCYKDIENVGKSIKQEDQDSENHMFDFCIPVPYCWGIGDTHAYHGLIDLLYEQSKLDRNKLGQVSLDLQKIDFEDIITKYSEKQKSGQIAPVKRQIIE